MTGLDGRRVYLDWNATAPLRPEAREAMAAAMDLAGNPSSVHAEGRAARAAVERARAQVADLVGCAPGEVAFTSGATEGARTVLGARGVSEVVLCPDAEHDAVARNARGARTDFARMDGAGRVSFDFAAAALAPAERGRRIAAITAANGETGVRQDAALAAAVSDSGATVFTDAVQAVGKAGFSFAASGADYAIVSAHKIGGPKGIGALVVRDGAPLEPLLDGGGQEGNRRSGTENVIGIAGFGAAAEAARREAEAGAWRRVEKLRIILENTLADAAPDLIVVGQEAERLPNTSCLAMPGWRAETQVMQMDLAGFAVSAGSACSSGKVRESRALRTMGLEPDVAASAIRVSLGPETTEAEVRAFAEAWTGALRRRRSRAA